MSIGRRVFVISMILIIIHTAFQVMIVQRSILPSFFELEIQLANKEIRDYLFSLNGTLKEFSVKCRDWACWDDMYDYMSENPDDVAEALKRLNLGESSFRENHMHLMCFLDPQRKVRFGRFHSLDSGASAPVDIASISDFLGTDLGWMNIKDLSSSATGFCMTKAGLMLLGARPILTSRYEGPARGILIFGRLVSPGKTNETVLVLPKNAKLVFNEGVVLPQPPTAELSAAAENNGITIEFYNDELLRLQTVLPDFTGSSSFKLVYSMRRTVSPHGFRAVSFAVWSSLGIGFLMMVGMLISLRYTLVKPIQRLIGEIGSIEHDEELAKRLSETEPGEIGNLSSEFNKLLNRISALRQTECQLNSERERFLESLETKVQERTKSLIEEIQERKHAEDELRRSKDQLQRIACNLRDIVFEIDPRGIIKYINNAIELYGYSVAERTGKSIFDHVDPAEVGTLMKELSVAGDLDTTQRQVKYRKGNGDWVWLEVFFSPIIGNDGIVQGISCAARDMTERKKNYELEIKAEKAIAASKAKSEFLATMSHEIRTPMNAIIGFSELLSKTTLTAKQREYLDISRSSARSLLGLIDNILDLSKIEAGKLDLNNVPFSMRKLVIDVVNLFTAVALSKDVRIEINIDIPVDYELMGDEYRLRQVCQNLLSNAVKFTENDRIVVRASLKKHRNGSARVTYEIEDWGIGIPPDKINLLFNTFTQADSSTARKFGGSGLGLAICRHLIEMMGGRIGASLPKHRGAIFGFELELPLSNESVGIAGDHAENDNELTESDILPSTVLIVEDNEINMKLVYETLCNLPLTIVMAEDGLKALHIVESRNVDLILMDCMMPELDGFETTRRIRERERMLKERPRTIIALTALASLEDRERCLAAGMNDFIAKPISTREMVQTVLKYLRLPDSETQS